jgi:hypothetical protein
MRAHPFVPTVLKQKFSDEHMWAGRSVVIAYAALAGLTVVVFTWLADHALAQFFLFQSVCHSDAGDIRETIASMSAVLAHHCQQSPDQKQLIASPCRIRNQAEALIQT